MDLKKFVPTKANGAKWKGPTEDGVTFSLLCRFLQCPERFRVYTVEGLRPKEKFNHRIEYGNMWHLAEECHATGRDWQAEAYDYSDKLCRKFPMDREEIDRWYRVMCVQFPVYLDKYKNWGSGIKCLAREEVFDVAYQLPSGRKVRLRGKRDGRYFSQGKGWVWETKTKGTYDEETLRRQLSFDLQTMMYVITTALGGHGPNGVIYNVVRRPLSGGKGTIVRHKETKGRKCPKCKGKSKGWCVECRGIGRVDMKPEETWESYQGRLRGIIDGTAENSPGRDYYFQRWEIEVSIGDVKKFRDQCLNPLLERLCDWWEWTTTKDVSVTTVSNGLHYRMPYGISLPLLDSGATDYDSFLDTGSRLGLEPVTNYFSELG